MNYKLTILPLAKMDLEEIASWYETCQKNLGKRFLKSIKEEIKILRVKPILYQIRYDRTRVALIQTFPYLIHFEIDKNELRNALSRKNSFISYFDDKDNIPDLTVDNLKDAVDYIIRSSRMFL